MKNLFNLLFALPLMVLVACSSEKENMPAPSVQTYTMTGNTGGIESRVTYTDEANSMHCSWEVGDIVTLANAGGDTFEFVVNSVDNDGVGTMAFEGVIPSADNFTGTATYAPRDDAKAGIQTANDNTEHLKYGEAMVATLTNQKIDGAQLTFTHPSTAVYKVTFKAPMAFEAGSKLTMSGAWTEDAVLSLNFSAAKDDIVIAYIIHTAGTLASGDKMKFSLDVKDGDTYSYTFESKSEFTYAAGKYWLANISNKEMEQELYVDLGLPSGTLWATCNLGADKPEGYGNYYAWGEIGTKSDYSSSTSKWSGVSVSSLTSQGVIDADGNLTPLYDAATQNLGGHWRMSTLEEQDELRTECTWLWTTRNGVNGYKITGSNGKSIFLPAAGGRGGTTLGNVGKTCDYWSSTVYNNTNYAYDLNISSSGYIMDWGYRYSGECIRPIYATTPIPTPTPEPTPETEYVDLGLPSGVKWAKCNLGASKPEEYGDYYGWGCTEPYATGDKVYWAKYFSKIGGTGTDNTYCGTDKDPLKDYVSPNNISIAGTKWDVARQKLGGTWRMPNSDEIDELMNTDNCNWQWTTENGVTGYKVTSKHNGNSIFLPSAGYRYDTSLYSAGSIGGYWISSPPPGYSDHAYSLYFSSGYTRCDGYYRFRGYTVRPVSD